jgi:hypothetical protein
MESIVFASPIMKDFKEKYGFDILNFMFFTDGGDTAGLRYVGENNSWYYDTVSFDSKYEEVHFYDEENSVRYKMPSKEYNVANLGGARFHAIFKLLEIVGKRHNANTMFMNMATDCYAYAFYEDEVDSKKASAEYKDRGYVEIDPIYKSFDVHFMIMNNNMVLGSKYEPNIPDGATMEEREKLIAESFATSMRDKKNSVVFGDIIAHKVSVGA